MRHIAFLLMSTLFLAGCAKESTDATGSPEVPELQISEGSADDAPSADEGSGQSSDDTVVAETEIASEAASSQATPVPVQAGSVAVTPDTTTIQFVGKHTDERPDRTGVFAAFAGSIQVDEGSQMVESISLEIDTNSLTTAIERLTTHLKSGDFFEVQEFPTATFQSTSVAKGSGAGQIDVRGNLNLHGVEKEISFPATVTMSDAGLTLTSEFVIDRTDFGITFGPDNIKSDIDLTVVVGQKTVPPEPAEGGGGGGRGGGGRGRRGGGGDPAALMERMDADQDGKLSGDEIPGPMRENLAEIDADGDGSVSLEELQQRMGRGGGRGRGRGDGGEGRGGPGGGPGGGDRPQRPPADN